MSKYIKLKNKFNTEVTLCTIGASIFDIKTLDRNNICESILYRPLKKDDFEISDGYYGKTIGRTGGRVSNSKFILNNKEYIIKSSDPNGLHGGSDGLSFKEFEFVKNTTSEYKEVIFSYLSKDLESGYPGNLTLKVIYRLYNNINKLTLRYEAYSDKDTLLNLSNHSYFNLSGNAINSIEDHKLYINASNMEEIKDLIPQRIVSCDKIYSFKNSHRIGDYLFSDEIINNTNGYDFPYIFDDSKDFNIILKEDESGRVLKVKTTYPVVVIYTCNYVGDEIMNNGTKAMPYNAVCLECMYHPNTINSDFISLKKDILRKDMKYDNTIEYYFEVEND